MSDSRHSIGIQSAGETADLPTTPADAGDAGPTAGDTQGAPNEAAPKQDAPKGGAPALNANRLTAGLRADPDKQAVRLTLGSLPASLARVERDAYAYRRVLEQAVLDVHGGISLVQAHAVDTATRWWRHGQAAQAWLKDHDGSMEHGERLSYLTAIAKAADARDKALERLKLEISPGDQMDRFYADLRAGVFDAAPAPTNAPAAKSEPLEADSQKGTQS
jgi:hypothetical protein